MNAGGRHRGFHESLPENSLAAFEAAVDAGEVNDESTFSRLAALGIERFDTDALTKALAMRDDVRSGRPNS